MSIVDKIKRYQRNIEKCDENEERILHCISKLSNLPVTVQHLQETGVGRTVNALRKYEGGVGDASKALVAKWKAMVASEETSDGEDEDETCVLDASESYGDRRESPKFEQTSSKHKNIEDGKYIDRHKTEKRESGTIIESSKNDGDLAKSCDNSLEKEKKHDRHKHSHKRSRSKDRKSGSKRDDPVHCSKRQADSKPDSFERKSSGSSDDIKSSKRSRCSEEVEKKRKTDSSSGVKKETKRRKYTECESDETKIRGYPTSEDHVVGCPVKIKEESSDRSVSSSKTEDKYEKRNVQDKLKGSGRSKCRNDTPSGNELNKNVDEKLKRKIEAQTSDTKDDNHRLSSKEYHESRSHNCSSSDKRHDKIKDKSKKKHCKEGKGNKGDGHSKHGSKDIVRIKQEIDKNEGIDCNSGASFAEALGMCMLTQPSSKKRSNNSPNSAVTKLVKTEQASVNKKKHVSLKTEPLNEDTTQPLSLLAPNVKLQPLSVDLASTLPEISPNYKPLPYINPIHRKEEDKTLMDVIYVKNQRTKVYSGNKSGYTSVPSLFAMCMRVLIENIDALEFTGGVPYDIIKPVLERATPDQLFMLEHYNPYLIEDTDCLWQYHCNREFRTKQREEMETWREMYMRCLDEREAKLKTLTANIKQSIDKSVPLRSTKLAYVDNVVKPPRNVLKKQAKYGTANAVATSASSLKNKLITGGTGTTTNAIYVPPPPPMSRTKTSSSGVAKKTKAPLMAKALQLIKGRYKR